MRLVWFSGVLMFLMGCTGKQERDIASLRPNYSNYNWTGDYQFADGDNIHTLKLIRGRVDADYQIAYSTTENDFGGSIWMAKDYDDSIQIRFTNNFTENAANVPYQRGDVLFTLVRDTTNGTIGTRWYLAQPSVEGAFVLLPKE